MKKVCFYVQLTSIFLYSDAPLRSTNVYEIYIYQRKVQGNVDIILNDIVSNSTATSPTCHGATEYFSTPTKTLSNLPIFVFAFTCHQNIFTIYNELSDRTPPRLKKTIATSILCALFLYYTVAIEGYRTFGNHVNGDILVNYPETAVVTLMRLGIAIMVILSYPLQLDPSRRSIISLVKEIKRIREKRKQKK